MDAAVQACPTDSCMGRIADRGECMGRIADSSCPSSAGFEADGSVLSVSQCLCSSAF